MEIHFFHITWVTHNTRMSERMKTYNVKLGKPVLLSIEEEAEIAEYIYEIVKEDMLRILSFNICVHHVHMIILCGINDRDHIGQKLKAISSKNFLDNLRKTSEPNEQGNMIPCSTEIPKHLWAQKYNWTGILTDEQLSALNDYVINNRIKHNLPENERLNTIIQKIVTPYERIFDGIDFYGKFSNKGS